MGEEKPAKTGDKVDHYEVKWRWFDRPAPVGGHVQHFAATFPEGAKKKVLDLMSDREVAEVSFRRVE